jgi:hypothetical protein
LDDAISWHDRAQFYYNRTKSWYFAQSNDKKAVLKVCAFLVVLYVAFGGRFGVGVGGPTSTTVPRARGNYGSGNVYEQYYSSSSSSSSSHGPQRRSTTESSSSTTGTTTNKGRNSYQQHQQQQSNRYNEYDTTYDDNEYHHQQHQQPPRSTRTTRDSYSSSSFHMPNLLDGSVPSMMILAGIAYLCHRNGINPMQAIFFLNMMGGRGGGRRRHGGGGYRGMGGGGGFGYGGGGFGRPRRW